MTKQEFIDDLYRRMVLQGMEYEVAYREACDAADVREEHQAFDNTDLNKLPDEYWEDAPEWAEWVAMDKDGEWFWYKGKPFTGKSVWFRTVGRCYHFKAPPSLDWTKSLTKRPQ
ncbi:MAG TPA: hypothetical protein VKP88_08085 [Candidatus Paceibacterota bacterium]|nr:hypothetical protein [Candidatus Paceibacterota bacterium]